MLQAFVSFLIVFGCGYLGTFLHNDGCIMMAVAAATACIVYAIKGRKPRH